MGLVRSAGIRGFRSLVSELGGDPEDIAVRCEIPVAALDAGELLVPDANIALALETAALELDCPDFGLRLGSRQDVSLLGPLGVAVQHAGSLLDAVHSVTAHLFARAEGLRVQQVEDPQKARGVFALRYGVGTGRPTSTQSTALVLSFIHRAGLDLAGGPYGLRTVDLPHQVPDVTPYEQHFGVPVRTGRPVALMRVASNLFTAPLPGRDDEMRRLAEEMLARQGRPPQRELVDALRTTLATSLSTGIPRLTDAARQLAMHPRTLQRMLEAEGTTFAEVLDDLRRQTARHLLTTTTLPVAQVGRAVGYSEAATFSRRARGWWGRPPLAVRRGDRDA